MNKENRQHDHSEQDPDCRTLRQQARALGVSPEDLPFMLKPAGATVAALLVHGFTGTPWEMRPVAEHLAGHGIASLAVRLPGHGTSPEDLAGRKWQEWLDTVESGIKSLDRDFDSVYGVGMSTGCLLLLVAKQVHALAGLILFSPYLKVRHRLAPLAGWLRWVRPYQVKTIAEGLNEHYYDRRPVAGVHQINLLLRTVRQKLSSVSSPIMAFNGAGDQTVDFASGRELVDRLGAEVRIHELYGPDVPHVLTGEDNPSRQAMFVQAVGFVQGLEQLEPASRER